MIQWYNHTTDLLLSWDCLTVMVVSVVCAAFRWFHMCYPYDKHPEHYYPARKLVTAFFLCQLLNVPFLLRPSLPASVYYSASFELFITSAFLSTVLDAFFKRHMPYKRLSTILLIWLPIVVFAAAGICLAFAPDTFTPLLTTYLPILSGVVAFIIGIRILQTMHWIVRQIDGYHKAEFSNEADFPYAFAKKLVWLPLAVLALCWIVLIAHSSGLLALYWLILAIFIVYYTIIILRPQIGSPIIDIDKYEQSVDTPIYVETCANNEESREHIRKRVIEIARSRYLEPHLTRRDIVGMFGFGERTIAGEIITSYGFYDMINALRLEHARRYRELHPNETKESVAINSGFKDRYAMRHGELRVGTIAPEILDGFSPNIE